MLSYLDFVKDKYKDDLRPLSKKIESEKYKRDYFNYQRGDKFKKPFVSRYPKTDIDKKPVSRNFEIDLSRRRLLSTETIYDNNSKLYYLGYLNFINGMNKEEFKNFGYDVIKYPARKEVYKLTALIPYLESCKNGALFEDSPAMFELSELYTNPHNLFQGKRERRITSIDNIGYYKKRREFNKVSFLEDINLIDYNTFIEESAKQFTKNYGVFHLNTMLYNDFQFLFRLFMYAYVFSTSTSNNTRCISVISHKDYGNSLEEFFKKIDMNQFRQIKFLKSLTGNTPYNDIELSGVLNMLRGEVMPEMNISSSNTINTEESIKNVLPEDKKAPPLKSMKKIFNYSLEAKTANQYDFIYVNEDIPYITLVTSIDKKGFIKCAHPASKITEKRRVVNSNKSKNIHNVNNASSENKKGDYQVVKFYNLNDSTYISNLSSVILSDILFIDDKGKTTYNDIYNRLLHKYDTGDPAEINYNKMLNDSKLYQQAKAFGFDYDRIRPDTDSNGKDITTIGDITQLLPVPQLITVPPNLSPIKPITPTDPQSALELNIKKFDEIEKQLIELVKGRTSIEQLNDEEKTKFRELDNERVRLNDIIQKMESVKTPDESMGNGINDTFQNFTTLFKAKSFNNLGSCGNGQYLYVFTF